jgi:hypothetical protein
MLYRRDKILQLERENRILRQEKLILEKQLHLERTSAESTQTIIEKETYNIFSHIARIIEGETTLVPHTAELLETYAQFIIKKKRAKIFVYDGLLTKNVFSIDEPLQRPIKRVIIFKQYQHPEEAALETLVSFPPDGPKRPFGTAIGRFYVEEEILGCHCFDFLFELEHHPTERSKEITIQLRKKLLRDQAFFQANPPCIPASYVQPPQTGKKLFQAFKTFIHTERKLEHLTYSIGDYLDSYACLPYRDAWPCNTLIALQNIGIALDIPFAATLSPSTFIAEILRENQEIPLQQIIDIIISNTYQNDFKLRYQATESRDRLHILYPAASPPDGQERELMEQHYQECYHSFGGKTLPHENRNAALINNSIRSAFTFVLKKPHPSWKSSAARHICTSIDAVLHLDDILPSTDRDYLIRRIKDVQSMIEASS